MKLEEFFPIKEKVHFTFSPRLDEIVMSQTEGYPDLDVVALKQRTNSFNQPKKIIPLENGDYELKINAEGVGLFRNDILLAFMDLQGVSEFKTKYLKVKLIYVIPTAKSGKALLIMLNGTRSFLKTPLLIDGAVFKDGVKTIKALNRREGQFIVSVSNFKTGEITSYDDDLIVDKNLGIIVEGYAWPAYIEYAFPPHISPRLFT